MEIQSRFDQPAKRNHVALSLSILGIIVGGVFGIRAIGQKGTPNLTNDERLELRNLQVSATNAQNELQATSQYQKFQEAQKALQDAAHKVFTSRKISETDYTICDGDGAQPVCSGVAKGTLELRPVPKQQAKK